MGFISGVIVGVALAAGAAAWYMSRAGSEFRDRYRVDRRLGDFGDEIEVRTRDVRAQGRADGRGGPIAGRSARSPRCARGRWAGNGSEPADEIPLDEARAAAAEEAAEIAADVEAKAAKVKKAAKDEASSASDQSRSSRRTSAQTESQVSAGQDRQSTTAAHRAADDAPYVRPTVAVIDTNAGKGRAGLPSGRGSGSPGPACTPVRSPSSNARRTGVIPSAVVRTEAGKTRQVRTIDLEPVDRKPRRPTTRLALAQARRDPRGAGHDQLRQRRLAPGRREPVRRPVDVDRGDDLAGRRRSARRPTRCRRRTPRSPRRTRAGARRGAARGPPRVGERLGRERARAGWAR